MAATVEGFRVGRVSDRHASAFAYALRRMPSTREPSGGTGILRIAVDPRLRLNNAVLGLSHRSPPWPAPLEDAGYEIVRIEQPVTTEQGGKVVVDLLFAACERNALLAVECKGGTVQEKQARVYQELQPVDLVRTASITLPDPTAATLDIAYAVPPEWAEHTTAVLPTVAPRAGVLVVGSAIEWRAASPIDARLAGAFANPIEADLRAIPRLMPVDEHSEPAALAPEITNEIHAAIESGRESVSVAWLVEQVCWGWPRYGRAFQGRLVKKTEELLRDGQKNELKDVIVVEPATRQSAGMVRLLPRPAGATTQAGELRGARAVRNRLDAFRSRVTGRPVPPIPGQLELLFELDDGDDDDDDED